MLRILLVENSIISKNDFEYIAKKLHFHLEFIKINKFNITEEIASEIWNENKDFYNTFDFIIVTFNSSLCRIFLQNNFKKQLVIWIVNRFDYAHQPDASEVGFPDNKYYDLIKKATTKPNVLIINITHFDSYYTRCIKNIDVGEIIIKPIGIKNKNKFISTKLENKNNTFFIGPYYNDNNMLDLASKVKSLGFKVYNGTYNGPYDLAEFAGVIHIPYSWTNFALFEALQLGIIYFIPSLKFLKFLIDHPLSGDKKNHFFWSPPLIKDMLYISEWYSDEFKDNIIYFDSFNDLKEKINNLNYEVLKNNIKQNGIYHKENMLNKWKTFLF